MADDSKPNQQMPWAGRFSNLKEGVDETELFVVNISKPALNMTDRTVERLAEHADADAAVQQCRSLIDNFLSQAVRPGVRGKALFELYRHKGPDPYIVLESGTFCKIAYAFNAWNYAKIVCFQLCNEKQPEASLSLSDLKGRYREYNRLQLASHLLQDREVRVIRACEGTLMAVKSGTAGRIGLGSPYISGWEFDWSIELPVVFEREGMDAVTFGIPYDLLEYIQPDEEYLKSKAAL